MVNCGQAIKNSLIWLGSFALGYLMSFPILAREKLGTEQGRLRMCRLWKGPLDVEVGTETHDEYTLSPLWHAEVSRVE